MNNKKKSKAERMICANCKIREIAESDPNSFLYRAWKWHSGWCPLWNSYQKALAEEAK